MFVTPQFIKSTFEGDYSLNGINESVSKFGKAVEEVALHVIKSSGEMFFYAVDSIKYAFKATLEKSSAFFSQTIKATTNLMNRLFYKSASVVVKDESRGVGNESSSNTDGKSIALSGIAGSGENKGATNPETIEDSITVSSTDKAAEIQELLAAFFKELIKMSEDNSFTDSEKEVILAQMKEGMQSVLEGLKIGTSFVINEFREVSPSTEEVSSELKSFLASFAQQNKKSDSLEEVEGKDSKKKEGEVVAQDPLSTGGFWSYFGGTTTSSSTSNEKK